MEVYNDIPVPSEAQPVAFRDDNPVVFVAGEKACQRFGARLPEDIVEAIRRFRIAVKSPLGTPVGGGHGSLNVTRRQALDLDVCMRPVRCFPGVPLPVRQPGMLDVILVRENTEDVCGEIGWERGRREAAELIQAGITETIRRKRLSYDMQRPREGATKVKTSEFVAAIIENMALRAAA